MIPDVHEMTVKFGDGSEKEFRRCGFVPDLFAARDGTVVRLKFEESKTLNGYPALTYREIGVSLRTLVADAWMPGWRATGHQLRAANGDRSDCRLENITLVEGAPGRPASQALQQKAELYQTYRLFPDAPSIADDYGVTVAEVFDAVRLFDPELLRDPVRRGPVRALRNDSPNG